MTTRGVLLLYTMVATVAYGKSIPVNGSCSSLLMQRYPTCNQENARDLGKLRDLTQHYYPNDGGRCWQQREQERKRRALQSSHGELVTHIRDDRRTHTDPNACQEQQ